MKKEVINLEKKFKVPCRNCDNVDDSELDETGFVRCDNISSENFNEFFDPDEIHDCDDPCCPEAFVGIDDGKNK